MTMQSSGEVFIEKIRNYSFIDGSYTMFINKFPKLELELTKLQLLKLQNKPLNELVFKAEQVANMIYPVNAGILGQTTVHLSGNKFVIQGSLAVIEKLVEDIFGN